MKKIIAFMLTLTMLSCTACGTKTENLNSDDTQKAPGQAVSASAGAEDDSEPEETESSSETAIEEIADPEPLSAETKPARDKDDNSGYEEAVRAYYAYLSEPDIDGILHISYPEAYFAFLEFNAEAQGYMISEMLEGFTNNNNGQIRLDHIIDAEPADPEDCAEMGEMLGIYRYLLEYVEENGAITFPYADLDEIEEPDMQKYAYHIPEAYLVTCSVLLDYGDGEESDEQTLLVYYIEDEGWKVEASMIGYVRKSKQASANANAKSLYNAAATVSVEFDADGKILPSSVISSDNSKDHGIDTALAAEFKKSMKFYFEAMQELDYFIVIENGIVKYVVCCDAEKGGYIGRYPEPITSDDKLSFDEMYESCLSDLD